MANASNSSMRSTSPRTPRLSRPAQATGDIERSSESADSASADARLRSAPVAFTPQDLRGTRERVYQAACNEDPARLDALLKAGANIEAKNGQGYTPLHLAVKEKKYAAVSLLAARGASVECRTKSGNTPLISAALQGDFLMVEQLLKCGADPGSVNAQGVAALSAAAQAGCLSSVLRLCEAGVDVNQANLEGATALHSAAWHASDGKDKLPVVRTLLRYGARLDGVDHFGMTPFLCAVRAGSVPIAAWLHKQGCNPRHEARGNGAFVYAAELGRLDMLDQLQAWKLLPATRQGRRKVLAAAMRSNDARVIARVLELGCEKLSPARWPECLRVLAEENLDQAITVLMQWGAVPDRPGNDEDAADTPLQRAVKKGSVNAARALLHHGAGLSHPARPESLVCLAAQQGSVEMIKLLVEHGLDLHAPPLLGPDRTMGRTPLMAAAAYGHLPVVQYLLQQHASPAFAPPGQETPAMLAAFQGHVEVLRVLLKHLKQFEKLTLTVGHSMDSAIENGHAHVVEAFLELGYRADLDMLEQALASDSSKDALIEQLQHYLDMPVNWLASSAPSEYSRLSRQFLSDLWKAFRDGLGKPGQFKKWLVMQGIRASLARELERLAGGLNTSLPLLSPAGCSAGDNAQLICLAILLSDLRLPDYAKLCAKQKLSGDMVRTLTANAEVQLEVIQSCAQNVLETLCWSPLRRLTAICVSHMNWNFSIRPELAPALASSLGFVPSVVGRVLACWQRAVEEGRATIDIHVRADALEEYLEKRLRPLFVKQLGALEVAQGFYDTRAGTANSETYHAIVAQQLGFLEQYRQALSGGGGSAGFV